MRKILSISLMLLLICSQCFAASIWVKSIPLTTDYINSGRTKIDTNFDALDKLLANYRQGCRIVYTTAATITVELGEVMCSNAAGTIRHMAKNASDTVATWSDIDTGAEANSTTYYLYAASDGAADTFTIVISTSSSAPTGETYFLRLGKFYNDASGNITDIQNDGFFSRLGTIESKSQNVTYRAMTDGFIAASTNGGAGGSNTLVQILSDAATPPTTVMWRHQEDSGQVATGEDKSGFAVIKEGNNYWVDVDGMDGVLIWWIPLN